MYENLYEKRQAPVMVFAAILVVLIIASYIVSGLFLLEGVTLDNLSEKVLYICMNPFQGWFSRYTVGCMGVAFLIWIILIAYYQYYYRNFHSQIEHGSADWLSAKQANAELCDEEGFNRILSQNVQCSIRRGLSNFNMLVIGSSGSFKTTSLMHQNLLQMISSYVVLDVKGDTQRNLGSAMKAAGYNILSLNLKDPKKSNRYNPMANIYDENDLLRVVKAIQDSVRPQQTMSNADPFWDDGVRLYLQALFYYEWLDAREKNSVGNFNNILLFANMETQMVDEETTRLQALMKRKADKYGAMYPPVRDYRKLKIGAAETVRSIVLMVNAMLAACETAEIKRLFSADEINIKELGMGVGNDPSKKTILFLIIPDNNSTYNFIINMFYTQLFDTLIRLSDDVLHRPLPIPVEVWMDEFYAGARPADADRLLGVVRSRNISMIPILQSVSQIQSLYPNAKWETIMDNTATVVYLGSGPLAGSTHEFISKALGEATIDSRSDNVHRGTHGNTGLNFTRIGRKIMTEDEVKRMPPTKCIIFMESRPPIYDDKAIPFDKDEYGYKAPHFLKERYQKALDLPRYEHPVFTIYDEKNLSYITIRREKKLQFVEGDEAAKLLLAAKNDPSIYTYTVNENDLLYLSWGGPKKTRLEIEQLYKEALKEENIKKQKLGTLAVMQPPLKEGIKDKNKENWDLSETLEEILAQHYDDMTTIEKEEVLLAMDEGLPEEDLKRMLILPVEKMVQMRRAYKIRKKLNKE